MKFTYTQLSEYRKFKGGLSQNYESVLESFVRLSKIQPNESISETMNRQTMGKKGSSIQNQNSIMKGFIEFCTSQKLNETTTYNFEAEAKLEPTREKTFVEKRADFGRNLIKLCYKIKEMQKDSDLNKNVSFFIREGLQVMTMYGKTQEEHILSEKLLLNSVSDRFAEKKSDVTTVNGLIQTYFPNPSNEKTPIEKGTIVKKILENAKIGKCENENISEISSKVTDDKFVTRNPNYTFLENEYEILTALLMQNQNLFITGSAGLGKSTMIQQFAHDEKIIYIRVGCDYESDPSELYFTPSFENNRVIYHVQSVGQAFTLANQTGSAIIELAEINSSNEATMIALHSATDDIKSLDTVIGKIALNEGVKVLIVGTGNLGYKGTRSLTQALASRMIPFEKQEPTEKFILEKIWKC